MLKAHAQPHCFESDEKQNIFTVRLCLGIESHRANLNITRPIEFKMNL